jgi:ABC-type glycerol-3-phosphate transport system substrate-binding protein
MLIVLSGSVLVAQDEEPEPYTFSHPSWMWEEGIVGEWHKARAAEFQEAFPYITVDQTQIASSDFETTIATQLAAGDAPDLLPAFTNMLPPLIEADLLAPLDDCLADADFTETLLPSISVAQRDGVTYGIPLTMSPQSLLYNQELLDAAGIESIPTTVEELFEAAQTIKDETGAWGYGFPTDTSDVLLSYIVTMQWVLGFGSDWSQPDGSITANADENKEALTWIQQFIDADLTPVGMNAPTLRNLFAEGQVGFMIDGPWVLTLVKGNNPDLYPSVGYAVSPTPTHAAITGGAFYAIPKDSPNFDDACEYLKVINTADNQREWLEGLVQIPGTSVAPGDDFLGENPWVETMVEVAANYPGGLGYAPPGYQVQAAEFRQIVVDHVAQIWAGQATVDEALDELQAALEEWAASMSAALKSSHRVVVPGGMTFFLKPAC